MIFLFFLFFFCVKVKKPLSCTYGSCDVHGVRTTKVRDITMMYCKERYMENVPRFETIRLLVRRHEISGHGKLVVFE